jgi:hypothetical protein
MRRMAHRIPPAAAPASSMVAGFGISVRHRPDARQGAARRAAPRANTAVRGQKAVP